MQLASRCRAEAELHHPRRRVIVAVLHGESRSTQVERPGRGCVPTRARAQGPLLCRTQRYISHALPTRCGTRVAWCYTAQAVPLRRQVTAAGVARPSTGPRPPPLQDSRYTPLPWIPPNGGGSMPQQVMRTNEPSVRGIMGAQCRNALATPNPVRTGTRFQDAKGDAFNSSVWSADMVKSRGRAPGKGNRAGQGARWKPRSWDYAPNRAKAGASAGRRLKPSTPLFGSVFYTTSNTPDWRHSGGGRDERLT